MNLLSKTQNLLNSSSEKMEDIAKNTGLSYHWIRSVKVGKVKHPSVNFIQKLYEHLSGTKINLE